VPGAPLRQQLRRGTFDKGERTINPLNDFPALLTAPLSVSRLFGSLTVALICGLILSLVYRYSYRGTSYSRSFVQALVAFALITTLVIIVIGNNLARAFGLVGSMSIVRFRMAIKDSRDIVFIFFALSVGMAAGVGLHMIAIAATLFIGAVTGLLSVARFGSESKQEFLLQFHCACDHSEDTPYLATLKRYAQKYTLVNVRSVTEKNVMELSYYITLKKLNESHRFIGELGRIDGVSDITFFFGEE
jgi:hypothetical protein